MKNRAVNRIYREGYYIAETGATVRDTALKFGVGKSTVHKDVTEKLKSLDPSLYEDVRKVFSVNLSERHIRGGIATKKKYELIKEAALTADD